MIRAMVVAIAAMGLWSSAASADTVYVDPTGANSGGGTKTSPWRTLAYACNNTPTGDVIKLNPGTFTETAQCSPRAGVSIIGSGRTGTGKTVVRAGWSSTGNFNNDGHLIRVEDGGNQTIANFVIDGAAYRLAGGLVTQNSDNLVIRDLDVMDFNWVGMWLKEGSNLDVYNCYVKDAGYESDGYCSGNISIASLTDSKIHDCTINSYTAGYGLKHMGDPSGLVRVKIYNMNIQVKTTAAWNGGQASNMSLEMHGGRFEEVQIYNCTLNMNVSLVGKNEYTGSAYSIRFHHNQLLTEDGYGIETSTSHLIIDSNYIYLKAGGDGAFHDYGTGEVPGWTDISIHHNYIYNCRWRPIMFSAPVSKFRFYNNTVEWFPDAAWTVYVAELSNKPKDDWIIQNNIFYCAKGTPGSIISGSVPTNFRFDNNCVRGLLLDLPTSVQHNNITGVPGWKLTGSRPRPYYEPASATSPIVNAGSLSGLPAVPFAGIAVDIGAFEFQPTAVAGFGLRSSPVARNNLVGSLVDLAGRSVLSAGRHTGMTVVAVPGRAPALTVLPTGQ